MSRGPLRILFVMRNPVYLRNFESTIELLAARGHRVHVAFEASKKGLDGEDAAIARLAERQAGITWGRATGAAPLPWIAVARWLRLARNYLRYLEPRYAEATKLRARAARHAPASLRAFAASPLARSARVRHALDRALAAADGALPVEPKIRAHLARRRIDLVLVTPLMHFDSLQVDYVRAARALGIPSALPVFSWDNLTNKGLMHAVPDHVWVWNVEQQREAVELHRVREQAVEVTGAPAYDAWFGRVASTGRDEFCRAVGLAPERPYILWLCSSAFIAPKELAFVRRWIQDLRGRSGPLSTAGVLVRPHPMNVAEWRAADLSDLGDVAIHPRAGADPRDDASRADYYDAMQHAAAVVGINTSALIESAIAGPAVHTIRAPEFRETQDGTLHFQHLLAAGGGLLHVAQDFDEHAAQLEHALADPGAAAERNARFLRHFVRPHGLDTPASPLLAAAIERAARPLDAPAPAEPAFERVLRGAGRVVAPLGIGRVAHASRHPEPIGDLSPEESLVWAEREIQRIVATPGPVIAGPWTSEVGFELLYWIPLLRGAVERHPGLAERLTVVSRGGAGPWYDGIAAGYADVFDYLRPDELAELRARGSKQKQLRFADWERELLERVAADRGLEAPALLPPTVLYKPLQHLFISDAAPHLRHISRYAPLTGAPDDPDVAAVLPDEYVAIRFYFSLAFPATDANRALVSRAVRSLTEQTDVVVLNTGFIVDDHRDAEADTGRVVLLQDHMTLTNNLAVQSQAIAGARAFVGTYGGLAYLPCFMGVPSLGLYSGKGQFNPWHVDVAQRIFSEEPYGDLVIVNADHMDLVGALAGAKEGWPQC